MSKKLPIPTKLFSATFSEKQLLSPIALRYLGISGIVTPITPKIRHMCENRDRNTLWWRVTTGNLANYKRVVRSWCARRARVIFTQQLKAHGYDAEGKKLPKSDPKSALARSKNLRGTVSIMLNQSSLGGDGVAWQMAMKDLVEAVVKKQETVPIEPKGRKTVTRNQDRPVYDRLGKPWTPRVRTGTRR
ncbi:hypothetical protein BDV19DRAFT_365721 [Aspergillus venezuelensis]